MNELPLHDIHLPAAVSAWPPAIGWWILPLIILGLAFGIYKFTQYHKRRKKQLAYKKLAVNELTRIKQQYAKSNNNIELLRAVSTLLRRISLSYLPRESVASLTGEQWIETLNKLSKQTVIDNEFSLLLAHAAYQKTADFDQQQLLETCESWINGLPDQTSTEVHA